MSGKKTLDELFLEACQDGRGEKVNAAIVLGVDVNTKDASNGWTGLLCGIGSKHENVVDILLAHPPIEINGKDNGGYFPLWYAAERGLTSVVAKLGRMPSLRGVNDQGGQYGWTPLSVATCNGKDKQATGKKKTKFRIVIVLLIR